MSACPSSIQDTEIFHGSKREQRRDPRGQYATVNKLPIKEVGPILTYQLSAAAMPKNQPALREAVSKAIKEMRADGTIDRLSNRWLGVSYQMSIQIAQEEKQ